MEKLEVITDTSHCSLTYTWNRLDVDNGEIVKIIINYFGDYKIVQELSSNFLVFWLKTCIIEVKMGRFGTIS